MPDPNSSEYGEAALNAAWPLVKASGGRAFLLFTSLRAMNAAHKMIQARMAAEGVSYPLLLQGEKKPAANCSKTSAASATPCCWAARASGKVWTWPARRFRWW